MTGALSDLEGILGHEFNNPDLLNLALVHSSMAASRD
ncbi:MAG: ribonuclease III, partial [Rhodospirillaceae bacterium]|nr:ribonuclease III [Rhodospirillaceae bacterium]